MKRFAVGVLFALSGMTLASAAQEETLVDALRKVSPGIQFEWQRDSLILVTRERRIDYTGEPFSTLVNELCRWELRNPGALEYVSTVSVLNEHAAQGAEFYSGSEHDNLAAVCRDLEANPTDALGSRLPMFIKMY